MDLDASKVALVKPFIAKHDIRYEICGMQVMPCTDGGVLLCGTDGHRLCVVRDPSGKCDREMIVRVDVPAAHLKPLARLTLEGKRIVVTRFGKGRGSKKSGEVFVQPGDALIDATFPDWRKILPTNFDDLVPGIPGSYNCDYLRDAIALDPRDRFQGLQFLYNSKAPDLENTPLFVRYTAERELLLIITPMLGKFGRPLEHFSWLDRQRVKQEADTRPKPMETQPA